MQKEGFTMYFYRSRKKDRVYAFVSEAGLPIADQPHEELIPNSTEGAAKERHAPVISVEGNVVTVSVGSIAHAMDEAHNVGFVAIETKEGSQIKNLPVGAKPEAKFVLTDGDELVAAYAYCNLHGLWKTEA